MASVLAAAPGGPALTPRWRQHPVQRQSLLKVVPTGATRLVLLFYPAG